MFLASPITFPNLGITVDPSPVAFTVFGKDIYWYGIIIASGFLLAVLYMLHRAKDFGVTQDDVLDMILWAVPIGVVCARLYYCIFYWELYEDDPISMLHVRQESLHHGQQRAALGAALRRGQARVSPDDQQPRTGADGQDAAGAAVHLPSASFCARILSTQHLWHMAT